MTSHPSARLSASRLLLDLAAGRLDPAEVDALTLWLQSEATFDPPDWVQRRAERIARQRLPVRARPASGITATARRIVARLVFDSQCQPQFVGLRAARTQVRRLLYQADNIEVDLEMSPQELSEGVRLAGQVVADLTGPSCGFVRLSTGAGEWLANLDGDGEFWLDNLAPGAYRLEVVLGERVLEVPVLPI